MTLKLLLMKRNNMKFYLDSKSISFIRENNECIFSYEHELKIQKARENARRTEKEKEIERYQSLLHDFMVNLIRKMNIIRLNYISIGSING